MVSARANEPERANAGRARQIRELDAMRTSLPPVSMAAHKKDGLCRCRGRQSRKLFCFGTFQPQLHQHREVVAISAFPLLMGAAEAPWPFFSVLGLVQLVEDPDALRIARPTLIVEQAGRDEDLVEDVPLLVIVGAERLGVLAGKEVEQF